MTKHEPENELWHQFIAQLCVSTQVVDIVGVKHGPK